MSFNTRGLGLNEKRKVIRKLISQEDIDFLMIQESKLSQFNRAVCNQLWPSDHFDESHADSIGRSGGILSIWDSNKFSATNSICKPNFILTTGLWDASSVPVTFVNVYAPASVADRH